MSPAGGRPHGDSAVDAVNGFVDRREQVAGGADVVGGDGADGGLDVGASFGQLGDLCVVGVQDKLGSSSDGRSLLFAVPDEGSLMATCPNGHANPDHQQFCGDCGLPLPISVRVCSQGHEASWSDRFCGVCGSPTVAPSQAAYLPRAISVQTGPTQPPSTVSANPPPPTSQASRPRWGWISAAGISVAVIGALVAFYTLGPSTTDTDARIWSALPHTMGCLTDSDPTEDPSTVNPPPSVRAIRATLTHLGAQQMGVQVEFARNLPPVPEYEGEGQNREIAPGSLTYFLTIAPRDGPILSVSPPGDGKGWKAEIDGTDDKEHNALVSAKSAGNMVNVVLDLKDAIHIWGAGQLAPEITVNPLGRGTSTDDEYGGVIFIRSETCAWDTPVGAAPESTSTAQSTPAGPQPWAAPGTGSWGGPSSTVRAAPPSSTQPSLPDADAHGFVGYAGGRCNDADRAIAMGRTSDSLVVVCQTQPAGPLYYVGFGLQNRLPILIPGVLHFQTNGFVVTNNDTQYTITPDALTIYQPSAGNTVEPMTEYWTE